MSLSFIWVQALWPRASRSEAEQSHSFKNKCSPVNKASILMLPAWPSPLYCIIMNISWTFPEWDPISVISLNLWIEPGWELLLLLLLLHRHRFGIVCTSFHMTDLVDVGYDNHMEMVWKWNITQIVTGPPRNATTALLLYGNEQSVSCVYRGNSLNIKVPFSLTLI